MRGSAIITTETQNDFDDLECRVIRCKKDPMKQFRENPIDILTALRLSSTLGLKLDYETETAAYTLKRLLKTVPDDEIGREVIPLLSGRNVAEVLLGYHEILEEVIPEISPMIGCTQTSRYHYADVFSHTIDAVRFIYDKNFNFKVDEDFIVKTALFFHDIGKPLVKITDDMGYDHFYNHAVVGAEVTQGILDRFKCDAEFSSKVVELVKYHDIVYFPTDKSARRMLSRFGEEQLMRLLVLRERDNRAHTPLAYPLFERTLGFYRCLMRVIEENNKMTEDDLSISGDDLISMGYERGKQLGDELKTLLDGVKSGEYENTYLFLTDKAKSDLKQI